MTRALSLRIAVVVGLLCGACSSGAAPTANGADPSPSAVQPAGPGARPRANPAQNALPAAPAAPAPVAPLAAPVDLLHAVRTEVAVSSVYRDQRSQADKLVDGDLTTAWNSRTADLVGAWIEVRVPADATVTSIAITPGFARVSGTSDLFTGNHRVSQVRVLRDGAEVGVYPLEVSAPVLVSVPVSGPGGVYRIEVTEVVPGGHADWRETCISELQILGRAPDMHAGARLPRTAVGALPEPRSVAGTADRALVDRNDRRDVVWLATAWGALQREIDEQALNTGEPDFSVEAQRDLERQRVAMLSRIAGLVEPIDEVRADALRIAASHVNPWGEWGASGTALGADLATIGAALDAVGTWLGDDEARCRTARMQVGIRLQRVAGAVHTASYYNEIDDSEPAQGGEGAGRDARRGARTLERDDEAFAALVDDWDGNSRGCALRLLRREAPALPAAAADWAALRAQLEAGRTACGWAPP